MPLNDYEADSYSMNGFDTPAEFCFGSAEQAQGILPITFARWLDGVVRCAQAQAVVAALFKGFTPSDNPLQSRMHADGLTCFVLPGRNRVSVPATLLHVDIPPELLTE